jgi:hypothetical protein
LLYVCCTVHSHLLQHQDTYMRRLLQWLIKLRTFILPRSQSYDRELQRQRCKFFQRHQ